MACIITLLCLYFVCTGAGSDLYLGLPFLINRSKTQIFQYVMDRVRKKLNGWKEKFLTKAGKEILIKSMVQAIPNHIMQCYKLPDNICDNILSLVRRFWWGKSCDTPSICWKSWDKMCEPKGSGGMGFVDLKAKNLSLLAKQGWRIIKNPNSLLAKVLKARYFPHTTFMNASMGQRPSYLWRSIIAGRKILDLGARIQVGCGQNIHIWEDRWIPLPFSFKLNPVNRWKWYHATVGDLMLPASREWNIPLLESLFCPYEVQAILQIPLSVDMDQDQWVWHHSRNGLYSVKTGYIATKSYQVSLQGCSSRAVNGGSKSVWNSIWAWPVLPKIKHFIWSAMHGILPLGTNLSMRNIGQTQCPQCCCKYETDKHVLFECPYAKKVWNQLALTYLWNQAEITSFYSLVCQLIDIEQESTVTLFFITCWKIWKQRCSMHFDKSFVPPEQLVSRVWALTQEQISPVEQPIKQPKKDKWQKPLNGMVTINVGAAIDSFGKASFGAIIQNTKGYIVDTQAGPLHCNLIVEHAELQTIFQGLTLGREKGCRKVQLFTDSELAYDRITSAEKDLSLVSPLVLNIRHIMQAFEVVEFEVVRRQGNSPAHLLAKLGLYLCSPTNWGNMPPNDVLLAVMNDSVTSNI